MRVRSCLGIYNMKYIYTYPYDIRLGYGKTEAKGKSGTLRVGTSLGHNPHVII